LKTYETCHHRSLKQQQGFGAAVRDGRVFLAGTLADRSMRRWLEEDEPQPGGMVKYLDELFEEHTGRDAEYAIKWKGNPNQDRAKVRAQVVACLTKLEPLLYKHVVPFDYQPELRFRTPIAIPYLDGKPTRIDLVGGIDIAVRDHAGDFELLDLKNTANDSYANTMIGQLIFYSLAWHSWWGDKAQPKRAAFLTPLCREQYVPLEITREDKRVMLSRIIRYCEGVWRKEWEPREDNEECWNCDVKHACDKWSTQTVMDAQGRNRASFEDAAARRRSAKNGHERSPDGVTAAPAGTRGPADEALDPA
jgi:hypothetical protein